MARDVIARYGRWRTGMAAAVAVAACWALGLAPLAAEDKGDQAAAQKGPAKKKPDPGEARRAVETAAKLLDAGKTEPAIQALSTTLAAGNLPPAVMAKALLLRGTAYRQQKKPAQAISDFTSALWLKGGLSESDRADGLRQRSAAYQEAGLGQGGDLEATASKQARGQERPAGPPAAQRGDGSSAAAASTLAPEPTAQPAASGGFNLFAGLFGGGPTSPSASQQASQNASPAPPDAAAILNADSTTAERRAPPRSAAASAWSRQTRVASTARVETGALGGNPEPSRQPAPAREPPAAAEPAKATGGGTASGRLRIQIAAVRTQSEAEALAAKVKREHAVALASRAPEIDQTVMGNMGSFYRVLLGPFASEHETDRLCARLRGSGLDCLVTVQ
jgi:hypothetical protein